MTAAMLAVGGRSDANETPPPKPAVLSLDFGYYSRSYRDSFSLDFGYWNRAIYAAQKQQTDTNYQARLEESRREQQNIPPESYNAVSSRRDESPKLPVVSGVEQWRDLVCNDPFTWDCSWALAVIACESSGNPNIIGSELYNGQVIYFYGLFQVYNGPLDPYQNAIEAHIKYVAWQRGQVGRPWPNCP